MDTATAFDRLKQANLTGEEARAVLVFLCGEHPEAVSAAVDRVEEIRLELGQTTAALGDR